MVISRRWAWFLVAVGVWSWIIWPRFGLAIWDDHRAWSTGRIGHGTPTGFLWVHAALIVVSLVIGTIVGVLGIKAARRAPRNDSAAVAAPDMAVAAPELGNGHGLGRD